MKNLAKMMKEDPAKVMRLVTILTMFDRVMAVCQASGRFSEEEFLEALMEFTDARLRKDTDREALREVLIKSWAERTKEVSAEVRAAGGQ